MSVLRVAKPKGKQPQRTDSVRKDDDGRRRENTNARRTVNATALLRDFSTIPIYSPDRVEQPQTSFRSPKHFFIPTQAQAEADFVTDSQPYIPFQNHVGLPLQRKLMVGHTTDPLETEADQIADYVLTKRAADKAGPVPVRQDQSNGNGQPRGLSAHGQHKIIRRRATQEVGSMEAPPIVHQVTQSSGRPMDSQLRRDMEGSFGADFSRVRVHTEDEAGAAARSIGARAFTTGHHIVFANGQYAPTHTSGQRLIAHELAHVLQQGAATNIVQRAPNQSIDPSVLFGESDIYAAPVSDKPVDQMAKSEVDDEINRLERWIGKQNRTTPDFIQRERRLTDLYQRQKKLGAPSKTRRGTPPMAIKPRVLTESLDISQMTRAEMATELDAIVGFLRIGPSKSDIKKVTRFQHLLELALDDKRDQENEEVRRHDIAIALQPITTGNPYEDFRKVLTVIMGILPDPSTPGLATLYLPNGMAIPVSNEEATALKTQAGKLIKRYALQTEELAEDTYQAFEERRQKAKEHPIVHGLVKWAAGVDDLGELEMFGKKEKARSIQMQINRLADEGKLLDAFNVSNAFEAFSTGYARQVGEWEAELMKSAGRWVIGLTVLKEGLTLLATAGAGSLISSARAVRGISALRATAEVASLTTAAGTAGAVGGYVVSQKVTGDDISLKGTVKAARVGGGTGFAIGAAPGAAAKAKEVFGVGKAATTVGNVARGAAADVVANTPVNIASAAIQGDSIKDAAVSTITSSAITGGGGQIVGKIAKGNKVISTVGGAVVGGAGGTAGAIAAGKDKQSTIIAGVAGTVGGALGPHLEESNKNYLERRSGGRSTNNTPRPPTTDERFDFSDSASGGAPQRANSPAPPESGVAAKFDLSDSGGSPPSDTTPHAANAPSKTSTPALTGSRRTSFGGTNEPPLPADTDIDAAVQRIGPAETKPAGSRSKTRYSRLRLTTEEEMAWPSGRNKLRLSSFDRGWGSRPFYLKDPLQPMGSQPPRRGFSDLRESIDEATAGTATGSRSPSNPEELAGPARQPDVDDPGLASPQRLYSEPSLRGGAEAAHAAGLPHELIDSGYLYTRNDLPDVVPDTVFEGARRAAPSPPLAAEQARGVAGRQPTANPDPWDAQNAALATDMVLIRAHLAALNQNPDGLQWTLENLLINRGQRAEGQAGLLRASRHTRPDLQFTIRDPFGNRQRFLIEYDRSPPSRSLDHAREILVRDPNAIVMLKIVGYEQKRSQNEQSEQEQSQQEPADVVDHHEARQPVIDWLDSVD